MQATECINIRTTPYAKALIERASQKLGVSVSSFIAQSAYEKTLSLELIHLLNTKPKKCNQRKYQT